MYDQFIWLENFLQHSPLSKFTETMLFLPRLDEDASCLILKFYMGVGEMRHSIFVAIDFSSERLSHRFILEYYSSLQETSDATKRNSLKIVLNFFFIIRLVSFQEILRSGEGTSRASSSNCKRNIAANLIMIHDNT